MRFLAVLAIAAAMATTVTSTPARGTYAVGIEGSAALPLFADSAGPTASGEGAAGCQFSGADAVEDLFREAVRSLDQASRRRISQRKRTEHLTEGICYLTEVIRRLSDEQFPEEDVRISGMRFEPFRPYDLRGKAYSLFGDCDRAMQDWRRSAEQHPEDRDQLESKGQSCENTTGGGDADDG